MAALRPHARPHADPDAAGGPSGGAEDGNDWVLVVTAGQDPPSGNRGARGRPSFALVDREGIECEAGGLTPEGKRAVGRDRKGRSVGPFEFENEAALDQLGYDLFPVGEAVLLTFIELHARLLFSGKKERPVFAIRIQSSREWAK